MGAHSWRHGTCTTSVCQHASGLCRLFDVSLSSRSLCLLSLIQNLSVVPSRLAATSLAAPRHPLHPPSPEPGITVAFTREFVVFICFSPFFTWSVPFCFHSVPVSYLAASPMAPPGRLWLSHLLPGQKSSRTKSRNGSARFLQCSTMFYNVLQCSTMVLPCSTNVLQCSTMFYSSTMFYMFYHVFTSIIYFNPTPSHRRSVLSLGRGENPAKCSGSSGCLSLDSAEDLIFSALDGPMTDAESLKLC